MMKGKTFAMIISIPMISPHIPKDLVPLLELLYKPEKQKPQNINVIHHISKNPAEGTL